MYQSAPLRQESVVRDDVQPQRADRHHDEAEREQRTDLKLPARGGISLRVSRAGETRAYFFSAICIGMMIGIG